MIKSDIGDIKNTGGRWGGASTAAEFLHTFAEDTPWIHLDIAGVAWVETAQPYIAKVPAASPCAPLWSGSAASSSSQRHGIRAACAARMPFLFLFRSLPQKLIEISLLRKTAIKLRSSTPMNAV